MQTAPATRVPGRHIGHHLAGRLAPNLNVGTALLLEAVSASVTIELQVLDLDSAEAARNQRVGGATRCDLDRRPRAARRVVLRGNLLVVGREENLVPDLNLGHSRTAGPLRRRLLLAAHC